MKLKTSITPPTILGEIIIGRGREGTYCTAKNAVSLDLGGNYTGIHISKKAPRYTLTFVCFVYLKLYLKKVVHTQKFRAT